MPSQPSAPRRTFTCRQCKRDGFMSMDELAAHWEDQHRGALDKLRSKIAAQTAHKLPNPDVEPPVEE